MTKILIVDDEPFNVDYLEQELEDLGYDTASAANGREALQKVSDEAPDLILLDVMMPELDGFDVCRTLKADDETRLIPVVIMTALGSVDDRIRGIEAGADDFLTKPVNDRELRARIQTSLRMKQTVDRKLGELRRAKDHFAKFVPEAVKRLVAANPDAPELAKTPQDVSVLFLDVTGYGRLSETLAPQVLNTLIERYFATYLDLIQGAGGDVNETAGDGFMAIFQSGDSADHARAAVDTALALLAATETLNRESNQPPISVHMGINSGEALVGSTRFEGARGIRWTFTASGPVTNLAARLAAAAEGDQIVASEATVSRLGSAYRVALEGERHLKNVAEQVKLFHVLGRA